MASKDSATRTKNNAKPIKGVDGAHHGFRGVFRAMSEEQHASMMGAIRDPEGDPDSLFEAFRAQLAEKSALSELQDKGLEAYMTEWRALTPAQQKKAVARLGPLREKVRALPPFKNFSLEVERRAPNHLAVTLCRREADFQGEEVPIELHTLERLLSPAAQAWEKAAHYVDLALADEQLQRHPVVRAIFEKFAASILDHTWDDLATPDTVLRFLLDPLAVKEAGVKNAQLAARSKNLGAKEWTRSVWRFVRSLDAEKQGMVIAVRDELQRMFSQQESHYTQAEMLDFAEGLEKTRVQQEEPKPTVSRMLFSEYVNGWLKKNGFRDCDEKTNETKTKPVKVKTLQIYREWLNGL